MKDLLTLKAYDAFMSGNKMPRKLKKAFFGIRISYCELRRKIHNWIAHGHDYNTFCIKCGNGSERMVDHEAEYPEIRIDWYCGRCGALTSYQDNSPLRHVLLDLRDTLTAHSVAQIKRAVISYNKVGRSNYVARNGFKKIRNP